MAQLVFLPLLLRCDLLYIKQIAGRSLRADQLEFKCKCCLNLVHKKYHYTEFNSSCLITSNRCSLLSKCRHFLFTLSKQNTSLFPYHLNSCKLLNYLQIPIFSAMEKTESLFVSILLVQRSQRSETWTLKARDTRRITAAQMKYMRRTAGYTRKDYKTNTQITKELKITPILDKLLEYKRNWITYLLTYSMEQSPS